MLDWFDYFQKTAAFPQMSVGDGSTIRECIDFVNDTGLGSIGTPDDAVAQIERLVKQSNGGFGAYLQLAHDWAAPAAKFRSFELFARHVAPQFQGQAHPTLDSKGTGPCPPARTGGEQHARRGGVDREVRGRAEGQERERNQRPTLSSVSRWHERAAAHRRVHDSAARAASGLWSVRGAKGRCDE